MQRWQRGRSSGRAHARPRPPAQASPVSSRGLIECPAFATSRRSREAAMPPLCRSWSDLSISVDEEALAGTAEALKLHPATSKLTCHHLHNFLNLMQAFISIFRQETS